MPIVISDASPIRYLVEIGLGNLLGELFGTILVPDVVAYELMADLTPNVVREWVMAPPSWVKVVPTLDEANPPKILWSLDEGESQAILLALSMTADLVLMDERAGTAEARRLGLTVVGTLGILDRCATKRWVSLSSAFERLNQTNFRAPRQLMQEMLAADAKRRDHP